MPNGSGPPDKFVFLDTSKGTPQENADALSELWKQGFRGPYPTVGSIIYIGGYAGQNQQ